MEYIVIRNWIAAVVLAVLPNICAAAAAPTTGPEILHGTGLRWGMTETEVEQALHAPITHGKPHYFDEFSMPGQRFADLAVTYIFSFDSAHHLSYLTLAVASKDENGKEQGISDLISSFTAWYGSPAAVLDDPMSSGALTKHIWLVGYDTVEITSNSPPGQRQSEYSGMVTVMHRVLPDQAVTVAAKELAALRPRDHILTHWAGLPILIIKRSDADMQRLVALKPKLQAFDTTEGQIHAESMSYERPVSLHEPFAHTVYRSIRPDLGVYIDVSTRLGCALSYEDLTTDIEAEAVGMGFMDPCHKDIWDGAGWSLNLDPSIAPLTIPKYHFEPNGDLMIGK